MTTTMPEVSGPRLARRLRVPDGHASEEAYRRAIGKRLRIVRVTLDCSQDEIAEAAGVTRNFVSAIERGAQGPDAYRLSRIAAVIDVPVAALLNGVGFDDWLRRTATLSAPSNREP
jgi:transcriptional regulator with XRE-family HTH domain